MKILIDAHMVGQNEGGNERYMKNTTLALAKFAHVGVVTYTPIPVFSHIQSHELPSNDFFRLLYIPILMQKFGYTHYFSSYTTPPYLLKNTKYISVLHDVYFVRNSRLYSYKDRLLFNTLVPNSLRLASAIVVPSRFIQSEVKKVFLQHYSKTHCIYEGVDPQLVSPRAHHKKQILIIASKNPRKNIDLAIQSFIQSGLCDYTLVVVGDIPKNTYTYKNKNIKLLGYVSDKKMRELYTTSACLLYLSDYEGFGLPVIEALANRTPVLALDTPINREIGGSDIMLIKNKDSLLIGKALRKCVTHRISARVSKQILKTYSWDAVARRLLRIFQTA